VFFVVREGFELTVFRFIPGNVIPDHFNWGDQNNVSKKIYTYIVNTINSLWLFRTTTGYCTFRQQLTSAIQITVWIKIKAH